MSERVFGSMDGSSDPSGLPGLVLTAEPVEPPARADRVAVAALVTGLLGLAPFAVVLGVLGLSRTKDPRVGGRRLALAGLVLGVLWTVGLVAVLVFALLLGNRFMTSVQDLSTPAVGTGAVDDDSAISAAEIEPGACLLNWDPAGATAEAYPDVVVVDCTVPHLAQAFGEVDLSDNHPDGAAYPGPQALADEGSSGCSSQVADNVDTSRAKLLTVAAVPVTSGDWAQGSRTVTCLVVSASGDLTSSLML